MTYTCVINYTLFLISIYFYVFFLRAMYLYGKVYYLSGTIVQYVFKKTRIPRTTYIKKIMVRYCTPELQIKDGTASVTLYTSFILC